MSRRRPAPDGRVCMSEEQDSSDSPVQDTHELSLDALVARFADGDDAALRQLLDREEPALRRHIEARTPPDVLRRQGVSDTIQKAALGIVQTRDSLRDGDSGDFRRLLTVIAERILVNTIEYERAKKRDARRHATPPAGLASDVLDPANLSPAATPTPSQSAMKQEAIESLRRSFGRLSPSDQRILHLVDYEGRSYEEAASELGVTYEAAKKRYLRALGRLRELAQGDAGAD